MHIHQSGESFFVVVVVVFFFLSVHKTALVTHFAAMDGLVCGADEAGKRKSQACVTT